MAHLPRILGILALTFAIACGSEESQPSGPNGDSGNGGASAMGGSGGSAGNSGANGASGASGASGTDGAGGNSGGSGGSTGGTNGSGGSTGGTDGSSATGGTAGTNGVSGTGGTGGTAGIAGTNGASGTGGVNTPYPAGPYGKAVGNTIENYQFRGHVNDAGMALSNTLPLTDHSLDDVRKSGGKYALIHLSAFYCAGCRSAANDLGNSTLALPVQQAGGRVIEVLFSGQMPGSQPLPELSAWITSYDLKVTALAPNAGNTLVASASDREHAYIVDLSTMKIVWTVFGSYGPTTNSSAKQGLAKMKELLGVP
jgi:hypothetical protein